MPGQALPDADGVSEPPRQPPAEGLDERGGERGAEDRVRQVLDEEGAHDLAGGEADGLEDGDVPQVAAHPGADGAEDGERGGGERPEAEEAEDLAEEPGVALGSVACLLPRGDVGDGARAEGGDGALHGVRGVVGVGEPQAGDAAGPAGGVAHGGGGAQTVPGRSPGV